MLGLNKEFNARAAIFLQQKFCDPHEGDYPDLKRHLEKNGILTLFPGIRHHQPHRPLPHPRRGHPRDLSEEDLF